MTDAFEVTGEFAPAESFSNTAIASPDAEMHSGADESEMSVASDAADVPEVPNGFVELGLAPELIQAVKDLGYTQPTTVQLKVIPMALPSETTDQQVKKFIDLMVSSQTGSGKTAAFLLPVLHTLLTQMAQAEAKERSRCGRRCRQRRSTPQARQAPRPHQPPQLQSGRSRRFDRLPHPRIGPASGA